MNMQEFMADLSAVYLSCLALRREADEVAVPET